MGCQQQWGSTGCSGLLFIKNSEDKKLIFRWSGSWLFQQARVMVIRAWRMNSRVRHRFLSCTTAFLLAFPLAADSSANCFRRVQMETLWNSHQISFLSFPSPLFRVMLFPLNFKAWSSWKPLTGVWKTRGHGIWNSSSPGSGLSGAAEPICCAGGTFCYLLGCL